MATAQISRLSPELREQVSLCMIVKNEERFLGACLDSVKDLVGEMVVVDTGSTDATVAIAASRGAKVLHFPWVNDFSAARNASLEAATRPWALVLDADEEVVVSDVAGLDAVLRQRVKCGYSILLHNVHEDGVKDHGEVFRLFRRDLPGMRYRGQLHEQLTAVAEGRHPVGGMVRGLELMHHGYRDDVVAEKGKAERNAQLSRALLADRPEDPYAWYACAMSLSDPEEATGMYRESLRLVRQRAVPGRAWDNWTAMIFWRLSDLEFRRGQHEAALATASEGHRVFARHPDFLLQMGRCHFESGRAADAVRELQLCLSAATRNVPLYQDARILGVEARLMLGLSFIALGRTGDAERPLREAVSMSGAENSVPRKALGSLLLRTRRPKEALAQFEEACRLDPADETGRAKLAEAQAALGQWAAALATLSSLRVTADAPERIRQVVESLLSKESTERVVHLLSDWYDADTTHADANYWLGFAALQLGDLASTRALWTQAAASRPGFMLAEEGLKLLPA
ncbi:MAG: hypothetical protein RL199_782 [Pseudomonadota bacterium]|jgi:tetratricopeptide (TPR) repeat protein